MYKSLIKDNYFIKNYEKAFFRIGVFLLPSAMGISLIFFLVSMLKICYRYWGFYLKDRWNFSFLIATFFLLISTFINSKEPFLGQYVRLPYIDEHVRWIGLFNWIPFFVYFWICQFFVKTKEDRIIISNLLIAGTLPLFFSMFTQSFLSWHGPFQALNGLIVWYQRKEYQYSGFFSNVSYTSCWLSIILPFAISRLNFFKFNKVKIIFFFFFTLITIIGIFLTQSIDSIFGIFITFVYLFFSDTFLAWLTLFLTTILFLGLSFKPITDYLSLYLEKFISFLNLYDVFLSNLFSKLTTRLEIIKYNLTSIYQNPLFGEGNGSYSLTLQIGDNSVGNIIHSHNFFHEIALSYGIFSFLFITLPILGIFYLSFKNIYYFDNSNKFTLANYNYFDKAWFTAFLILLLLQLADLQYFDARISCVFWLLLAGLKEISKSKSDPFQVSKN